MKKLSLILVMALILTSQVGAVPLDEAKRDIIKKLSQDEFFENAELSYAIYVRSLEIIAVARSGIPEGEIVKEYAEWLKSLQEDDGSFPPIITFDVSGVPSCDAYYYAERPKGFEGFPSCLYGFSFKKCPEYSYITTCSRAASTALILYALLDAGEPRNSPVIKKGVQYLLKTMKNGTYWTYVYTVSSSKVGVSSCKEAEKVWGFKEKPSLVATAYAVALLHRLGYNVSKSLQWLNSNLKPENLINKDYLTYLLENETPKWEYSFPFYQLGFPSVHFYHREPFESLVVPLVLIKEEGSEINQSAVRFIVSILNKTRISFAGDYTLYISTDLFWNSKENYSLSVLFKGANLSQMTENGTFYYLLIRSLKFKALEKNFTISGSLNFTVPEEVTWEPEVNVFLFKRLTNRSYMRVDCAEIQKCSKGCYNFKLYPHYDWWSDSIRPSVTALLWYYLAGETRAIDELLRNYSSLKCESELAGDYQNRGCTEDYALLLLLMDVRSGSFKEYGKPRIKLVEEIFVFVVLVLLVGLYLKKK
ncbi:hypothetical protein E3E31_03115 [Thermococcus sp. M39]|uniref:hypothetical protein n=1 Tax=unclassified Thermococcus TaxID=2627626 RepID=UPI00143AEA4E|nr:MULTISPECIES: hypothetical protein [unclassified Thermococcus]NJE07523.1 hypothetical protein [Thermococcus sp. M39]NJE12103.1 hypothetical protein [Thermococcus sp. LS2]